MKIVYVLLALACIGLAPAVSAIETGPSCEKAVVDTGPTPAGQYYVTAEVLSGEYLYSIWLYKESDGVPGCSAGDEHPF